MVSYGKSNLWLKIFISLLLTLSEIGCQPTSQVPSRTPEASPAAHLLSSQAEQALQEYYSALQSKSYEKAAGLFSTKVGPSRSELIEMWKANDRKGWKVIRYEIIRWQPFDERRIVFWVDVEQEGIAPTQYQAIHVLHLEGNTWYVGNATLERLALQVRPKTQNGLTILLGGMLRTISGIEIWVNMANNSQETIVWGMAGYLCGKLLWQDGVTELTCPESHLVIETGQTLNIPLVFTENAFARLPVDRPVAIEIGQFYFPLGYDSTPWSYHFDLKYEVP